MDVQQIRRLRPKLKKFLKRFDHCFPRKDTRAHLPVYVSGQLSDIPEKSVEPIALNAGVSARTLQEFLSQHHRDQDRLRDQPQHIVRDDHAGPHSIGIFDETSEVKKGEKTPGVQRQWCGDVGKAENCIVTVHLAYAREGFHCLLDGGLYLPESWSDDRERCREAAIPEEMSYRPKWRIALELYDHAIKNGLRFDRLTFDEGYGGKPELLRELSARSRRFVAEVPRNFTGWAKPPRVITRPYHKHGRGRGRGRKTPRLASGSTAARRVDEMLDQGGLRDQLCRRWRIKEGLKGPMVWEAKHQRFTAVGEDGLPGESLHLVVARDVLNPEVLKFFVSNAPEGTPVAAMLLVAFSRWRVERCFEDQKSEIGLDQHEGRRYQGSRRHLMLSCVSSLFLSRTREEFGGKNPGLTECQVHTAVAALIPYRWLGQRPSRKLLYRTAAEIERVRRRNASARKSHTKRTRRRLREAGIKLTEIRRCTWGKTWRCSTNPPPQGGEGTGKRPQAACVRLPPPVAGEGRGGGCRVTARKHGRGDFPDRAPLARCGEPPARSILDGGDVAREGPASPLHRIAPSTAAEEDHRAMIGTLSLAIALLAGPVADDGQQARPFLHPLFSDHVVIQRDVPVPVWGWAEPGQRVKVDLAGQSVQTTADGSGKWLARLGPYPAGGPHVLAVTGPKSAEVKDILVGDVWICSGQSNMEWSLSSSENPEKEIAAADHPRIRLFSVPKKVAFEPMTTVDASWKVCSPESAAGFTAVGYFFGRELGRELNVPIGLIHSSWGGTIAEAWASAGALEAMPDFRRSLEQVRLEKLDQGKPPVRFDQAMAAWWAKNDPGSAERPGWADPKFDSTAWKAMTLPAHWEQAGLPEFDGIAWFRKEIALPDAWDGKAATLGLGPVDDRDTTFVNGVEVGHMNQWDAPRNYKIPPGVLRAGRNVIAVRALDTSGPGGFSGAPGDMKLALDGDTAASIALAGPWAFKASTPLGDLSTPPEAEGSNPNKVTVLYNGMIAPLRPFAIKGAIWYQGESNASRASQYRKLLPTMIKDWRASFEVGDFPFYIVQLANFRDAREQPGESDWAELREAQYLTTKALPNVGLALAIDIGDAADIHPRNKQDVGRRLALAALASAFGRDVESSGPVFKAKEVKGGTIRLSFDHLGGGLVAKGGEKLEGFAIAGEDGKYAWADAVIDGDAIVVSSPRVARPANVRYAWADNPSCNLYNQAGLPAVPFRTDPPKD